MSEPVRKTMCKTCPFRKGSPHANLAPMLTESAINDKSRICHSTGLSVFYGETGIEPQICRGTRDIQLRLFRCLGLLEEETDECWELTYKKLINHEP